MVFCLLLALTIEMPMASTAMRANLKNSHECSWTLNVMFLIGRKSINMGISKMPTNSKRVPACRVEGNVGLAKLLTEASRMKRGGSLMVWRRISCLILSCPLGIAATSPLSLYVWIQRSPGLGFFGPPAPRRLSDPACAEGALAMSGTTN